ncbi:MAG: type II secretion system protein GspK [Acetobacter aceti]|uniref:type II secretion system protein GspK n=1 Tax=Acetobacter aceti TaxID=435 RepID=UPI001F1C5856|nr:type II secretion system protein GspK [Acetobacter aceti]
MKSKSTVAAIRPRRGNEDGFALLLVLWTLGFLSLIGAQALVLGKSGLVLEASTLQRAQMETITDEAITTELFSISTGQSPPRPEWRSSPDEGEITISVSSHADRDHINPNVAGQALLSSLLTTSGVSSDQANFLSASIMAWRMPGYKGEGNIPGQAACTSSGQPFHTFGDLLAVPGMTPAILARIQPHLSFAQLHLPDQTSRDPIVRQAMLHSGVSMGADQKPDDTDSEEETLIIVDAVASKKLARMSRHAEVILMPEARPVPWRVVRWETVTR